MAGLRSVNPTIRIKFMDIFSKSIRKRLYDRLMYIIGTQNWEHMGSHYWIIQCLELLLNIVQTDHKMLCSSTYSRLPSCTSVLRNSSNPDGPKLVKQSKEGMEASTNKKIKTDKEEKSVTTGGATTSSTLPPPDIKIKTEPMDADDVIKPVAMETDDDVVVKEEKQVDTDTPSQSTTTATEKYFSLMTDSKEIVKKLNTDGVSIVTHAEGEDFDSTLNKLAEKQGSFLKQFTKCTMGTFVHSVAQLSHRSTILAHKIWVDMFPQIWDLLEERHHQTLSGELGPFLSSGSHIPQMEGYRSSINTLVEGMSKCDPPIPIRPIILKYLGKTHNLWHQAALILEGMTVSCGDMISLNPQLPLQQPWLDFGKYSIFVIVFIIFSIKGFTREF